MGFTFGHFLVLACLLSALILFRRVQVMTGKKIEAMASELEFDLWRDESQELIDLAEKVKIREGDPARATGLEAGEKLLQ